MLPPLDAPPVPICEPPTPTRFDAPASELAMDPISPLHATRPAAIANAAAEPILLCRVFISASEP
jgi:hypothetical protein